MNVAELQADKSYIMVKNGQICIYLHFFLIKINVFMDFQLSTRQNVSIHPSSFLSGTTPQCVLFSEVVHTNKCYIRQLTVIDPDWLSEMVPEYFRRHRLSCTNEVKKELF